MQYYFSLFRGKTFPLFSVLAARAAGWRTRIFPFLFKKGCTKCGVVV